MTLRYATLSFVVFAASALAATSPSDATRHWWSHVEALASDGMEGRDTGSDGYRRAARYVADQFRHNGLTPAGTSGYFQTVPMHVVRLRADRSDIALVRNGVVEQLDSLREVVAPADVDAPTTINAAMVFVGSGRDAQDVDVRNKIVVRLNRPRYGDGISTPEATTSSEEALPKGALGVLGIDSASGPEPAHWPRPYSVSMVLQRRVRQARNRSPFVLAFNPAFADRLFTGSGHTYVELLGLQAEGKTLPTFVLPASLRAHLSVDRADLHSDNVLAVYPGADPHLGREHIVVSAHLDGYGMGEAVDGDHIYNGAFDDAAYVATLIELAERLHHSGRALRRSVLFTVFTGEEKGRLGSRYFMAHPTVPKARMMAQINLDTLRPLFPLKVLTVLGKEDAPLTATAAAARVAREMGIRTQSDPEPWRRFAARSDQASFANAGVPTVAFTFGYEPRSAEETMSRRWYAERYHRPGDDLTQPWDPSGAETFNAFFYRLVETLADAHE